MSSVRQLADSMMLGSALELIRRACGPYELVDHWQQGEFHHDSVADCSDLPGSIVVIATNCNGGIKKVLCFAAQSERYGLWKLRCTENDEFRGALPTVVARETEGRIAKP